MNKKKKKGTGKEVFLRGDLARKDSFWDRGWMGYSGIGKEGLYPTERRSHKRDQNTTRAHRSGRAAPGL